MLSQPLKGPSPGESGCKGLMPDLGPTPGMSSRPAHTLVNDRAGPSDLQGESLSWLSCPDPKSLAWRVKACVVFFSANCSEICSGLGRGLVWKPSWPTCMAHLGQWAAAPLPLPPIRPCRGGVCVCMLLFLGGRVARCQGDSLAR